ncbi:MAG TPA: acyclic terpene utilization AtuA family protein [Baekduia sp.]|uniref:acyclic terpene utilization AtuA family protein n=1 Tax=Baekduia sp. TaxID=2600305 RepID=UPI002BD1B297|nr:acyclic terpene utilization AtuA family protein [Baekduia sp.]HMJ33389.1 acyclic terpene utilization AtuA family protein [Baekduia sp.]
MTYIAAIGAVGAGVDPDALSAALAVGPQFIAADAGTTDAGAFALGTGATAFSRDAVKRDLSVMIAAGLEAGVPVIVGSAGTAGADVHVDWVVGIVDEIAQELEQTLRVAAVYAEQDRSVLVERLAAGDIRPLRHATELSRDVLSGCERVVAMMGVEPLQQALATGAQVVIAGRSSDAALFAALPLVHGFPEGLAWHAGKVVECGTMACETMGRGVMVVTLREDSFSVWPIGDGLRCTPQSVAAHSLYETADPYHFAEASGTVDLTGCTYAQEDAVTVRVRESRFVEAAEHTLKLEGATLLGYEAMIVGGVRDPLIIAQLDSWLGVIDEYVRGSVARLMGVEIDDCDYRLGFQVYGRNAVMGALEPAPGPAHEVGIVCTTLAPTQEEATEMIKLCRQPLLHAPIPQWKGSITGFACLHNPAWVELGPAYGFALNHVLVPGDRDVFRLREQTVGTRGSRPAVAEVA